MDKKKLVMDLERAAGARLMTRKQIAQYGGFSDEKVAQLMKGVTAFGRSENGGGGRYHVLDVAERLMG